MAARNEGSNRVSAGGAQRIVFFHPDLGIGGAERLIVDAAVGLQERGHKVTLFTSHCDPSHCFEEARDGKSVCSLFAMPFRTVFSVHPKCTATELTSVLNVGTLDVRVRGNSLFPSSFLGRFHILLATLRQIHLVLQITLLSNELRDLRPSTFIVDQLSACLPLLRWSWPQQNILFYCHFPDQLLARRDSIGFLGFVKKIYRLVFDWFEVWTMTAADTVVVNSKFTKSVVVDTFGKAIGSNANVIYPCVDTAQHSEPPRKQELWKGKKIFLSINRFEAKKGVELAIRAYHGLTEAERKKSLLVIAGEYDERAISHSC